MLLKKNDIVKVDISAMTAQGSGVGRTEDGAVIFVPFTAPGDELEARVLKVKKHYSFGKVERLINPSPARIEPTCSCFGKCGGCVYRHIDYNSEIEIKTQRVRDAIERIGGFKDIKLNPLVFSESTERYRNKSQIPAVNSGGGISLGFYANHSHRVIPCSDCLLQPECFSVAMKVTEDFMRDTAQPAYDERTGTGKLRHLYIRYAGATDELMICFVVNGSGLEHEDELIKRLREALPNLKTVVFNSNTENTNVVLGKLNRVAYGRGYITDILLGKKFRLSPMSFYQVNRAQAERLYSIAADYANLTGNETLLDLYCGTGTIGLTMADKCKRLIGVEIIADAVLDARVNAEENGVRNAEFLCGDAPYAAEALRKQGISPDVIILDPPRKGCDSALIETVTKMSPERIVYVSCDPETLARDLKLFSGKNYSVEEITPVDLFPRTAHVETVVLLRRKNIDNHL